nr:hypothetical protein GCM10020092_049100 [Actinoplanes digitatis]
MGQLDLRRLRLLRELRDRGTVTAVGAALHMTSSAVSQQLALLARDVGAPLLEPHGRRVRLTDAARLLLRHADLLFAQLEVAQTELDAYVSGAAATVRLDCFATSVAALAVPAMRRVALDAPQLTLRLREADTEEALDRLVRDETDVVVGLDGEVRVDDARFTRTPLLVDPLDVVLPSGHPRAAAADLRLADLAERAVDRAARRPVPRHRRTGMRPRRFHAADRAHGRQLRLGLRPGPGRPRRRAGTADVRRRPGAGPDRADAPGAAAEPPGVALRPRGSATGRRTCAWSRRRSARPRTSWRNLSVSLNGSVRKLLVDAGRRLSEDRNMKSRFLILALLWGSSFTLIKEALAGLAPPRNWCWRGWPSARPSCSPWPPRAAPSCRATSRCTGTWPRPRSSAT